MLADFVVELNHLEVPRHVQVKVHESTASLRSGAAAYSKFRGDPDVDYSDVAGLCHKFLTINADESHQALCALVRLAPPHIGIGTVVHELTHAAVWIDDLTHCEALTSYRDEDLAWNLGELTRQTVNKFYELGVWK